jgi:hypothetical protein
MPASSDSTEAQVVLQHQHPLLSSPQGFERDLAMRGPDRESGMPSAVRPIESDVAAKTLGMKKTLDVREPLRLLLNVDAINRVYRAAKLGASASS